MVAGRDLVSAPGSDTPPGISVEWTGGRRVFGAGTEVIVGRDPDADVRCDDDLVSSAHGRITQVNGRWQLEDLGSRNGTYLAGQRVTLVPIDADVEVRLGDAVHGVLVKLALAGASPDASPDGNRSLPDGSDDALRVSHGGQDYRFEPGAIVTFGRTPESDVPLSNPLVSRAHARAVHEPEGWVLEDLASKRGTFWNGHRIDRQRLGGAMSIWFGPEDAGERVIVVASGEAPLPLADRILATSARPKVLVGAVAAAVMAIVVAFAALILGGGGGDGEPDLAALRRATVRIVWSEKRTDGTYNNYGSGTIISADGLILTNAHVAAPDAPGSGIRDGGPVFAGHPDRVQIYLNDGGDGSAKLRYHAKVIAADGFLDLAVLRIDRDADDRPIAKGSLELPAVPLGKLADVHSGDEVLVLGYPLAADSFSVNVTRGVVGSRVADDTGHVKGTVRLNVDARINGGNSGGLAANERGEIIGVPSEIRFERDRPGEAGIGRIRPIDLAFPLIRAAQADRTYDPYRYLVRPTGNERATTAGFGVAADACGRGRVTSYARGATGVIADFTFANMTDGEDVLVTLTSTTGRIVDAPFVWEGGNACRRFELAAGKALAAGKYDVIVLVGPNYDTKIGSASVTVAA